MRDILVTLIVFGALPWVLRNPVNGILMWVWISVMNPHTQGWGFATTFPYAMIIALATMFSMLLTREPRALPWTALTATLVAFTAWMCVTLPFSMYPEPSLALWWRVMKITLMTFACLMLVKSARDIQRMVWMLALLLGFYGVKGGVFTLRSGGERVWGPADTFIGDNNALALALVRVAADRPVGAWRLLALRPAPGPALPARAGRCPRLPPAAPAPPSGVPRRHGARSARPVSCRRTRESVHVGTRPWLPQMPCVKESMIEKKRAPLIDASQSIRLSR